MPCRKTLAEFISDGNRLHDFKYDYTKSVYINAFTKVIIICSNHGEFLQTPHDHTAKRKEKDPRGCPLCANLVRAAKTGNSKRKDLAYFVTSAVKVHDNRYDYSNSVYRGMLLDITIRCKVHGEFTQAAHSHVYGSGCPRCGLGNNSKIEKDWLDQLGVPVQYRQYCITINKKRMFVDGFDPITKTVYEFYGDYWHGNPSRHPADQRNTLTNKTFGELYAATIVREQLLQQHGFRVISIWESEFTKKENVTCSSN